MTRWFVLLVLALAAPAWAQQQDSRGAVGPAGAPAPYQESTNRSERAEAAAPENALEPSHAARTADLEPHHPAEPHPVLPAGPDGHGAAWAGGMLLIILGMFLAAAVIGPLVRSEAPAELPPTHSHDEPPGASHHHGASGTVNPEPDHGHADEHH